MSSIELKSSTALLVFLAAVAQTPGAVAEQGGAPDAAPIELNVATAGEPFATRGRALITHADIDNYLEQRVPPEHQGGFLLDPERIGTMAENLALPRQLAARAIDDGIDQRPEVQAKMLQGLVTLLADEYMAGYFDEKELDDYEVVARELYLTSDRRRKATLDFSQILVVPDEDNMLATLEALVSLASRANAKPEEFDQLVASRSDDPAVDVNNASYTAVKPDSINQSVRDALLAMEPGQISEPVRSQHGWHILRLDAYHESEKVEFEQLEDELIAQARAQHRERVEGQLLADLSALPLELEPGAVRALLERYEVDFEVFDKAN